MRTNEQMMKYILETAKDDNRIRAVCMNGYAYPQQDVERVTYHIKQVHEML